MIIPTKSGSTTRTLPGLAPTLAKHVEGHVIVLKVFGIRHKVQEGFMVQLDIQEQRHC
jgi:hypothetical protein